MYYLCSENKGADQLRGYRAADLRLCFRICKNLFFSCRGSFVFADEDEEEEPGDRRRGKKRGTKVPRSKIKSLLSLDMPLRPPPGLAGLGKHVLAIFSRVVHCM